MAFFRKIKAGLVKSNIETFVGEEGNLFFDVESGELRLSDGQTLGGIPVSGGEGGGTTLTVSETGNDEIITNEITRVTAIRFDRDTGFNVENLGSGEVKVSLGSTFKTWKVDGQQDLVAVGEDTIRFIAGDGITIITDPTAEIKTITLSGSYILPTATDAVKGGVVIGQNLSITDDGIITVRSQQVVEEVFTAPVNVTAPEENQGLMYKNGEWINSATMFWSSKSW